MCTYETNYKSERKKHQRCDVYHLITTETLQSSPVHWHLHHLCGCQLSAAGGPCSWPSPCCPHTSSAAGEEGGLWLPRVGVGRGEERGIGVGKGEHRQNELLVCILHGPTRGRGLAHGHQLLSTSHKEVRNTGDFPEKKRGPALFSRDPTPILRRLEVSGKSKLGIFKFLLRSKGKHVHF